VLTKHMFEKPPPMFGDQSERQLGALEQITMRALEKKPENRYPSMKALIDDLDAVVGGGRPRAIAGARPSMELADALEPKSKSEMNLQQRAPAMQTADEIELPAPKRWPLYAGGAALLAIVLLFVLLRGEPAEPIAAKPEEPAAPPSLPIQETVMVRSQPAGAEIYEGNTLLGQTPSELPRPAATRPLELRLDGYQNATVALSATSSELDVTLSKLPTAPEPPKAAKPKPAKKEPAKQQAATPAAPKRKRLASEVVDPWAE
jgi:eukaryotic-like serine/threonine-protein kinase